MRPEGSCWGSDGGGTHLVAPARVEVVRALPVLRWVCMWKARLAVVLGLVGAAAGVLSPLLNKSNDTGRAGGLVAADIVGGVIIGGGIWAAIGLGIGALIDRSKHKQMTRHADGRSPGAPQAQHAQKATPGQAGWFADPFRRFEGRYWDGDGWTNHVTTNGRPYVDDPTT